MFPISINQMSIDDLKKMIAWRWMVAGGKQLPFQDDEVYRVLFAYSKGLPRDAIKICDETLRDLLIKGRQFATANEVEAIALELNLKI